MREKKKQSPHIRNSLWYRMRSDIGVRKVYHKRNGGFSLVELIIVIAIIAILAAGIAPALIRYINKSRKADDIALADTIGKTFQAAVTSEEDLYDLVASCAKNTNPANRHTYRIITWCACPKGTVPSSFHLATIYQQINGKNISGDLQAAYETKMEELLGASKAPLKFFVKNKLDCMAIATDSNGNLSVWVGGIHGADGWIDSDGVIPNTGQMYMLWPEVSSAYNELSTPSDALSNTRK